MAIGIDDLYDDDDIEVVNSNQEEDPSIVEEPSYNSQDNDDFVSDFLKTRGIDDIQKINFEDDDGQLIERSWNDLSKEEKINILNTPLETVDNTQEDNGLTNEEINFINQVRQSGVSIQDYLNQLSSNETPQPQYKIDDLSDDELYLLDLESRVGELSDDEAAQALNIAKQQSEELYKKQVEGIRKEYKEREDYQSQQEQAQIEQEQQQAFEQYQATIVDAIDNLTSIGNFDLNFEDSDKETLAEFMLTQDETGKNYLYQALQDPETLTKAAWFILNGEDALNSIQDYFVDQIKQVSKAQYEKGFNDAKNNVSNRPTVHIDKQKINNHRTFNSIDDLYDEE